MQIQASFPRSLPFQAPALWSEDPEVAGRQAIRDFGLRQKGWRGFDQFAWVQEVKERFPAAVHLAQTCSSHRPEYKGQAEDLFYSAPLEERPRLRDYFLGKLGLEELSCQMNGAGAAMCDKRAAFREIYKIAHEACHPQPGSGMLL